MLLFLIFILRNLNENINTHVIFVFHLAYARDHQPCIIFMDEIDAIGGRRFSEGTSADREIQR